MIERLQGAFTALVTPFDEQDKVDTKALARLVKAQLEHGIDGLVPCGTTGETATLTDAEQERVVKTTIEAAEGKAPIIAGTGSNSTRIAVENTKRAKAWGADVALVVCPYYNKPTQDGMFRHFKAIWEEVGMPIIAYNVPGRTASDLMPETIAKLVHEGVIIGLKDATANMIRAQETLTLVGDKPFAMLSGDDFTILPFVAVGGRGVISVVSNIIPGDTAKLVKATLAADFATARPLNSRIVEFSKAMFLSSNPIPVKAAMALAGWAPARVRMPLVTADDGLAMKVRAAMNAYRGMAEDADLQGWMS
ncbi:MAG: 4-hydroxy-tetrahydrodipicolinate synthase [Deltaproteobacteria bacterium]|nr:4-hydroxy-tetrahydrodipicolinate synthase [Deltaproteobacteria bacterium]